MTKHLLRIGTQTLHCCAQAALLIEQHPTRLAAAVGAFLLVGGSAAFALASLGPDPADLPVHTVLHDVTPLSAATHPEALAAAEAQRFHRFRLYRSETVRSSDTAHTLLQRLGVVDPEAAHFLRTDPTVRQSLLSKAGRLVQAETDNHHQLLQLTARWAHGDTALFQRLVVEKTPAGWRARTELAPLVASSRLASASIRSSLFAATDEADIPDSVATQLADIFSNEIDFRRALQRGDRLAVVYETLEADGLPLRAGKVLSAEFVNAGRTHQAVWFQDGNHKGSYYTLDGHSLGRAFLLSPVEFSRVTSSFSMRMHPVLQRWRAHLGTDFAAPAGTPVRSVGDGRVEFAGVQSGFGNVVFVNHGKNQVTVYAHLRTIGVAAGQPIAQGQQLGTVGQTGWATGPHLHFEFRINGVHHDPQTLAQQANAAAPVSAAARPAFDQLAATMRLQLSAAALVQQASAQ